ncbi:MULTISPECIES: pyrimidine-specific ribonucleoside hydrolase RihA [Dellaglioa]|uniref:Ribonucleoside hydrolase 1 n=3 Tax=Dellaglioa TaxID=2767880 RepID=A0A0R1HQB5_9LACO|nr:MULTISPECIES: pyrimidine-specific ribonucleoside hydrolase RihA [Dellaglioa]KRK45892.1 ribonucleoside hydrolase 1 [Dellaglioa algida DSM 15638]MCZ2491223.1 pyrimidine-specific ribonucleoside hydrolase RihA [Dellaglioa carnosa]MCZ2493457.1 pyrimidine-specific ribonucleoside hydrolase RihA [Dellaglioa carnosa]MCZ2494301.1 pyrimidine-specific ribonucleoside hydrolase RihA [Dellaglioa carnosa]MDK1716190.1 pyrimidine-specific ribonucleoside hydrolase RihA [Dellaglioa algida]
MTKTPIILDCDPGHDDALALMMVIASPEFDLRAVTTSAGNQTPDKTFDNACRLLTLMERTDIPVASGNKKPLLQELMIADAVHGDTGVDGTVLPKSEIPATNLTAIELIAETLSKSAEKVTMVVTGPMTNMALFLAVYPELKSKIEKIVFMGGSTDVGNVKPGSEFNIAVDPESAKMVLNDSIPLVMAGLNLTHQAQILDAEIEEIGKINNKVAQSAYGLLKFYGIYYGQEKWGFQGIPLHDPCTIAWMLQPELFTSGHYHVDVEVNGDLTRGETIVDKFDLLGLEKNTEVLLSIDRTKFVELLISKLKKFDELVG